MVRDRLVLHLLGYFEMLISGDFSVYNQIDILKRVRLHITEGKTYSGKLYVSVLNKKNINKPPFDTFSCSSRPTIPEQKGTLLLF